MLSDEERALLATIASIVRFKKGEEIYREGTPADAVFNIIGGIVKSYKYGMNGEHITAFLYPHDLFGLSDEGNYTNSTKAITPVTAYALPTAALRRRLVGNADLEFHVIAKLCHELREAQRHALLLAQKRADTKLAMFLQLQEHVQTISEEPAEIYLPMDRTDIADYVGMSLAAVSRGFHNLEARKIIGFRDRRHVKIFDYAALEELVRAASSPDHRARPHPGAADCS